MEEVYRRTVRAIVFACAGWFAFSLADTGTKVLTINYSVSELLTITGLAGFVISTTLLFRQYGRKGFVSKKWKWHLVRGFIAAVLAYCVVQALSTLPLADFYGIVFLAPILINVMSHLFLREHVGPHRMFSAVVGFVGVLIIAGPQFETYGLGLVFAFVVAVLSSVNAIIVRKIGTEDPILLYAIFPFAANFLFNLPMAASEFQTIMIADYWLYISIPVLVMLGTIGVSYGFAHVSETAIITPFHYTQMIWGILIGLFLFGDIPAISTILGSVLIVGAGLYVLYREHRQYVIAMKCA